MEILCDFDGTITSQDTIVFLTEKFGAGPAFRSEVIREIQSGRMRVAEAVRREMATVTLSWAEAAEILKSEIKLDPTFEEFVEWCKSSGHKLSVVSAGLEPVVKLLIGRFDIPIYAHPVDCKPTGWVYRRNERHNKVKLLKEARGRDRVAFIGDGTSDVLAAPLADQLFAKGYLAAHCRETGLPFHEFDVLKDVRRVLAGD